MRRAPGLRGRSRIGRLALPLLAALTIAVPAATARSTIFVAFRTPSGNIGCIYGSAGYGQPAYLRCDIRSGLVPKPPRPSRCDLDYGDSYGMGKTSRATVTCHGDTALDPRARPTAYGTTWARDGFRCSSATTGLRCTNLRGHGWFMSRGHSFTF